MITFTSTFHSSTHVLTEDTVARVVKDGKLYSKRLLTKTSTGVPKWGQKLIGAKVVKVMEESVVDPEKKQLVTYTQNIGYTKLMVCLKIMILIIVQHFCVAQCSHDVQEMYKERS